MPCINLTKPRQQIQTLKQVSTSLVFRFLIFLVVKKYSTSFKLRIYANKSDPSPGPVGV